MLRTIVAIVVGYSVWSVLWLVGNAALFGEAAEIVAAGEAYTEAGPLVGVLVLSVVCSLAAGITAARIAGARARGAVLVTAVLLLVTGIAVQAGAWSLMPAWYHLTFLALLLPVTVVAGRLGAPRATPAAA